MRKTKFLGRIFSGSAAAAALLCLSLPVQAADEPKEYNNFEFTPFVGYMAGGEFEVDDRGRAAELHAGKRHHKEIGVGAGRSRQQHADQDEAPRHRQESR